MSEILDDIYLNSPIWLQQGMTALYGWWWYRRRYNRYFETIFAELQSHDRFGEDQFRAYQDQKLKALANAAVHSRYYREVFAQTGMDPDRLSLQNLSNLPVLEKETLRARGTDLLTTDRLPTGTQIFQSSGTSGTPTRIYYTPYFHALELAAMNARNFAWGQVQRGARRVMFGVRKICAYQQARPPFWRYSPAENMAYASVFHLSPQNLPAYLDFFQQYRPEILTGFPSAIDTIARYALETGQILPKAKGVFTSSETVQPEMRKRIEAVWGCRLFDRYGAVEGSLLATQCEYGSYHVSPEIGIIEIIDRDGKPCRPGVTGEIVCTGLQNTLQPLIRYRIADAAAWAVDQTCPCGRSMPILERIEGRFEDICVTRDGREIVRFDAVFKGINGIREAQIVQHSLDLFSIYVVPGNGFDEQARGQLEHNLRLHVGDCGITVTAVEQIARTSSGKFRAVVCKLTPEAKAEALRSREKR